MKCFEKLVLRCLLTFTNKHRDPLQFAYKPHIGTDDAILTVLHNAYLHLDKAGFYVHILFIDFSSTFNTIQPHLLALKLLHFDVSPKLILWIVNFLLHRTQSVRFQNSISSQRHTCTGAPQGTVLSPALFTLYTNDCQGTQKHLLLNCLLVGCLTSQQQASVSQGRICLDNFTCCHTEIEVADQTFYLTQSQYTDTGPTSPSADPITPSAWQGSHWSANF